MRAGRLHWCRAEASAFGVMAVDGDGRITDFVEKPADPPPHAGRRPVAGEHGHLRLQCAYLYAELERDMNDPALDATTSARTSSRKAVRGPRGAPVRPQLRGPAPEQEPYWRDVGTIDAYWDANIDLTATDPLLNLYDTRWPIWTYQPQLPPAKFVHNQDDRRGMAIESMVSGRLHRLRARCSARCCSPACGAFHSTVNWSRAAARRAGRAGAALTRVVVDRGCRIPDGMVIGEDAAADARALLPQRQRHHPLVTREMLASSG